MQNVFFLYNIVHNFCALVLGSSHTEISRSTLKDSTVKTGRGDVKVTYGNNF